MAETRSERAKCGSAECRGAERARGDAAEVMRLCGAAEEEADLLARAAACFEKKGNLVSAAEARRRGAARTRRLVSSKA